jgi:DNA-binding response OmpR family regulator
MSKRVLVAEDDAAIRKLLVRVLARDGFEIDAVSNGSDALDRISITAYDAIVLDLMMPDINGFDVLSWIRSERPDLAKKLIVITAVSEQEMRHVRAEDVCAVLKKPFDIEDVTRTVRACAGEPETADGAVIDGWSPETA